jgi:hypothetical protein
MMKKMIIHLFRLFSIVIAIPTWNPNRILRSNAHSERSLQSSFSTEISKLTASNGRRYDSFGSDQALAISKNRIVIGAYGCAYLFGDPSNPQSGRSYSQLAFLTANDGETGDEFGDSVAIDGDIIVVGAPEYSNYTGAAYVYGIITDDENNNFVSISQVAKLTASNGVMNDEFGWSVAIHGNTILVGAWGGDRNGSISVGSVYLFGNLSNDPNTPEWTELQLIQPEDLREDDYFGVSVAMDDNISVIGAHGANAAYVFAPVDSSSSSSSLSTSWTQIAKLTGSTDGYFGYSVAVAGNWIVVSAHWDDNTNGNDAGAVFIFTKTSSSSSSSWTQLTQLLAADGAERDEFGISVSISIDASTIVVGAEYVDFNSTIIDSGAAYMFRAINSTTATTVQWTQMGKFVAADRDTNDYLGSSVAIENNIVFLGAPGDDSDTGSVYVVEDTGSLTSIPPTTTPTTTTSTPSPSGINMNSTNSPMTNISTIQPPTAEEPPHSDSKTVFTPGVIVGMSTIVGVVIIVLGIAFLKNRVKIQREAREQQQQQAMNTGDDLILPSSPLIAEAVVLVVPPPVQEVRDVTIEADAFLDPTTVAVAVQTAAAESAATSVTNPTEELPRYKDQVRAVEPPGPSTKLPSLSKRNATISNPTEKELPRYKDQVRAMQPPGPSNTNPAPSLSKRNHQQHDDDDSQQQHPHPDEEKEEGIEDQSPAVLPQQQQQQQQILHPDPPAAINYEQQQDRQLLNYKDQVGL